MVMEKRKLYAIASERMIKHGKNISWVPEIVHVHANDSAHAKFIFLQDIDHRRNYRIVAVGPVIGYHVEDEHGEKLRA